MSQESLEKLVTELDVLIRARYPLIAANTHEEGRFKRVMQAVTLLQNQRHQDKELVSDKGSGHSDLTRYVSRSKLDHEQEGRAARSLWSAREDHLTVTEARRWLSIVGDEWDKKDALHYVLSFASEREYELLGHDEKERREVTRDFLRRSLQEGMKQMGIGEARWVAGAHRNTDNPHIHLLLNRNALAGKTGELVRLARLPPPIIAHHIRQGAGAGDFMYGTILTVFAARIDERLRARTRSIRFFAPQPEQPFDREMVAPETLFKRPPNAAERLVGQWLRAEVAALERAAAESPGKVPKPTPGKASGHQIDAGVNQNLATLRAQVAQLDQYAANLGQPPVPAYLTAAELRDVLLHMPKGVEARQLRARDLSVRVQNSPELKLTAHEREKTVAEREITRPQKTVSAPTRAKVVEQELRLPGLSHPDGPLLPQQAPPVKAPAKLR